MRSKTSTLGTKILNDKYFKKYKDSLSSFSINLENFKKSSKKLNFDYLTETSSVYSSNIEGNSLDVNSFMNSKISKNITKDVKEIQDLVKSYKFAQENSLIEKNFLKAHFLSSSTILIKSRRGVYRNDSVGVFGKNGLIYLAIEAKFVEEKMKELFEDISHLLKSNLTSEEAFYYASLIHLQIAHIHPFFDGNGRMARLLEKWFLSQKLGENFWNISSEQYYKENRQTYYKNINLGVNYYELNYNNSLDFLLMLPSSLK